VSKHRAFFEIASTLLKVWCKSMKIAGKILRKIEFKKEFRKADIFRAVIENLEQDRS
jgi:hypothetical protein